MSPKRRTGLLMVLSLFLFAVRAGAQEPIPLPELNVPGLLEQGYVVREGTTGTKTDAPLIEVPQGISVITRDRLDAQKANNVVEALRYTPGAQGEIFGFDTRRQWFRIRGFGQTTTGLFRDGLRLFMSPTSFMSWDYDTYGVERVEVLRGPASILYGQMGPGGLVNLVTKRPTATPFYEVEFQAGSFDRFQGAFDLGGPITKDGAVLYRLTGLARDSDTQVDFVEDDRLFIAPALTWRPTADTTLTILGHYHEDRTASALTFLPASGTVLANPHGRIPVDVFAGEPAFNKWDQAQWALGYLFEHRASDVWTFRQNARYSHIDTDYEQVFGVGLAADRRTLNRLAVVSNADADALTMDTQAQAKFPTGPLHHTVLFGVDYQRNVFDDRIGFGAAPSIDVFAPRYGQPVADPVVTTDTETVQDQIGLYLQEQAKLYKEWVFVLGARHDWARSKTDDRAAGTSSEQDDRAFIWRAGLVYLSAIGLAPYASYSESFLPVVGANVLGEPFEPETGRQYEIGVRYQPPGMNSFVTVAAFDLLQQNVLTPDPADPFNRIQTGEVRSRGVEVEAVAKLADGLNAVAAYTYLDAEVTESTGLDKGKRPVGVPEHAASLWADYTIPNEYIAGGLGFGAGVRYIGPTFGDDVNTIEVPGYTLTDAAVHYEVAGLFPALKGMRLAVNVHNLFDEEHIASCSSPTACFAGPRRAVIGSIRYRW
jgi:iron complex outermembrane receptor protein